MASPASRTLYDQYITLTDQAKEIDAKKRALMEKILAKMDAEKIDKVEGDKGVITIASRAKWTYTPAVTQVADQLKELKKVEEKTGVATKEETRYLVTSLR